MEKNTKEILEFGSLRNLSEYLKHTEDDIIVLVMIENGEGQDEAEV